MNVQCLEHEEWLGAGCTCPASAGDKRYTRKFGGSRRCHAGMREAGVFRAHLSERVSVGKLLLGSSKGLNADNLPWFLTNCDISNCLMYFKSRQDTIVRSDKVRLKSRIIPDSPHLASSSDRHVHLNTSISTTHRILSVWSPFYIEPAKLLTNQLVLVEANCRFCHETTSLPSSK